MALLLILFLDGEDPCEAFTRLVLEQARQSARSLRSASSERLHLVECWAQSRKTFSRNSQSLRFKVGMALLSVTGTTQATGLSAQGVKSGRSHVFGRVDMGGRRVWFTLTGDCSPGSPCCRKRGFLRNDLGCARAFHKRHVRKRGSAERETK